MYERDYRFQSNYILVNPGREKLINLLKSFNYALNQWIFCIMYTTVYVGCIDFLTLQKSFDALLFHVMFEGFNIFLGITDVMTSI